MISARTRDAILLPLVICVILPGMAGAWWRMSHGDLGMQPPALSRTFETSEAKVEVCDVSREPLPVSRTIAVNQRDQ